MVDSYWDMEFDESMLDGHTSIAVRCLDTKSALEVLRLLKESGVICSPETEDVSDYFLRHAENGIYLRYCGHGIFYGSNFNVGNNDCLAGHMLCTYKPTQTAIYQSDMSIPELLGITECAPC